MTEPQIRPLLPTMMDEQALALGEEFDFDVWVDFRSQDDGLNHWHARRPGWKPEDIIHARDAENMRTELIIWKRENES